MNNLYFQFFEHFFSNINQYGKYLSVNDHYLIEKNCYNRDFTKVYFDNFVLTDDRGIYTISYKNCMISCEKFFELLNTTVEKVLFDNI